MLNKFTEYIKNKKLFNKNDKILLTVSGGIDSIVMLDLFIKSRLSFGIAHCNFNLRGNESNLDEKLVKQIAKENNIEIHTVSFKTEEYSKNNGISIEMAARDLRYEWFEKIRQKFGYSYVATAHHKNDVIETFILNISRGTGIKGLCSIQPKVNKIIRPVLFAFRKEIEEYCNTNNLQYREDASNATLKYKRNIIRHKILPELKNLNPNINNTIIEDIEIFNDVENIYRSSVEEKRNKIFTKEDDKILISINELKKLNPLKTYLFEFLKSYNFQRQNITDIIKSLDNISGKQFYSSSHYLVKDRDFLILSEIDFSNNDKQVFTINKETTNVISPISLKIKITDNVVYTDLSELKNEKFAFLDYDLLTFPLIIRKWGNGDYFYPIGMKKRKKISDFFIDNKFSIIDKNNAWLLCSGDNIVWVIGKRINERFKITNKTKKIFVIEMK
ncbi:MAG: tRNA lysidine(34) synthetase TilS [Bacteroidales bacterium]|nr:tRNA lysidine(34) synthetase TilS [Bacteroidales bacterium]